MPDKDVTHRMMKTAAEWWGGVMVDDPGLRQTFAIQLYDVLHEKQGSGNGAFFVLATGATPDPTLSAVLAAIHAPPYKGHEDDGSEMFLDFSAQNIIVRAGYRGALRKLDIG